MYAMICKDVPGCDISQEGEKQLEFLREQSFLTLSGNIFKFI